MRRLFVFVWLLMLLGAIGAVFYYVEWKYSLPTPVPQGYHGVPTGEKIVVSSLNFAKDKPLFLHFYNPDCPCSRFNTEHFKSLVKQYGQKVQFVVVPMTTKDYSIEDIQKKIGLEIPVLLDTLLAARCGVYSTPQAVLLNTDQQLFYRGNYNKSRYCSDKKTAFAQMALEGLLNHINPAFDAYALKAYGCELPTCTKQ